MSLHFYKSYDNAIKALRDLKDKVIVSNGEIYAITSIDVANDLETWKLV